MSSVAMVLEDASTVKSLSKMFRSSKETKWDTFLHSHRWCHFVDAKIQSNYKGLEGNGRFEKIVDLHTKRRKKLTRLAPTGLPDT